MEGLFALPQLTVLFSSGWFVLLTVMICVVIALENRDPTKTISWLLVLTLLPGLGVVLYLLFGENLRKRHWHKTRTAVQAFWDSPEMQSVRQMERPKQLLDAMCRDADYFDLADRPIMRLVLHSGTAPILVGNEVAIYTEGEGKFAQLLEDMKQAKDHIHLEYFIIKDSEIGRKIREVLIQKAQEGVKVRVLFDDIGSWRLYLKPSFLRGLRKAGCETASYLKVRFPFIHQSFNYRNHRKLCVIDGRIGYVGGINIGDEYLHKDPKFGFWRDTHLRLAGPSVYMLQLVFLTDWFIATGEQPLAQQYFPPLEPKKGRSVIQIAVSGADSPQETIYQAYFYAIAQARESIYIQTPYFVPDEGLMTALKTAVLAGVDVQIMFPAIADHLCVHYASLSYLEEVLALGAKVHFYKDGFIHSKVVLVDGEMASVGTANMDIRSFMINSEINAFIYDDETVAKLYQIFADDLAHCETVSYEAFRCKSFMQRAKESFCRLFSPLL